MPVVVSCQSVENGLNRQFLNATQCIVATVIYWLVVQSCRECKMQELKMCRAESAATLYCHIIITG